MLCTALLHHHITYSLVARSRRSPRDLPLQRKASARPAACSQQEQHQLYCTSTAADPHRLSRAGHSDVLLFGVEHNSFQAEAAEYILQHSPAAVVFENSFSAAGGDGAVVSCTDGTSHDGSDLVTMACATAARMQNSPPAVFDHVWQQLKQQCETELLAHMAAFVTGTRVVHGDRPKLETYMRMERLVSAADLDLAIEAQICINHADCLGTSCGHDDLSQAAATHQVFTTERDQILCQNLQQSSQNASWCVVGVVGAAHVLGIIQHWNSCEAAQTPVMQQPPLPMQLSAQSEDAGMQGVRRALLERFVELSCSSVVCADMQRQLSPLPAEAMHAYALTHELYGSPRMLLAMLPQQHLCKVCSGWKCDMWEVLRPLRDVRLRFGGPGYDENLVWELRQLYFELG